MRAYLLLGQVGGGWALEFESFLGPVKWHRADMLAIVFVGVLQQIQGGKLPPASLTLCVNEVCPPAFLTQVLNFPAMHCY